MSDEKGLPADPDEVAEFMGGLTFDPAPTPDEERHLLESLPPKGSGVMVVRSLRLPIEMALAVQSEDDQPISRADALRALTLLRPVRRVA